jgi:hypothetical protein
MVSTSSSWPWPSDGRSRRGHDLTTLRTQRGRRSPAGAPVFLHCPGSIKLSFFYGRAASMIPNPGAGIQTIGQKRPAAWIQQRKERIVAGPDTANTTVSCCITGAYEPVGPSPVKLATALQLKSASGHGSGVSCIGAGLTGPPPGSERFRRHPLTLSEFWPLPEVPGRHPDAVAVSVC